MLHAQRHQRVDDDDERERVEREAGVHRLRLVVAPLVEDGECEAEEQRADHARDVELNRVQRDGVRQIFLVDERRDKRLVRRAAECLGEAGDRGEQQDVPDVHAHDLQVLQIHEQRERGGRAHLHVLRGDQRPTAIAPVGEHAADEREEDDRELLQERVEAEVERRVRKRQHEPVLRDDLHPRADARRAGAEPLHAEVTVGERREHAARGARAQRRRRRRGGCLGRRGGGWRVDGFGQEKKGLRA